MGKRKNVALCLLLLDIDFFKAFNDYYGHKQGDDCIIAVAEAIKNSILRPEDSTARFGDEECVVILPDTEIEGALRVAKTIQQNVFNIKDIPKNTRSQSVISLSIGIACTLQVEQCDAFKLIGLADRAMYRAKENGRDQICYYQHDEAVYFHNTNITDLNKKYLDTIKLVLPSHFTFLALFQLEQAVK